MLPFFYVVMDLCQAVNLSIYALKKFTLQPGIKSLRISSTHRPNWRIFKRVTSPINILYSVEDTLSNQNYWGAFRNSVQPNRVDDPTHPQLDQPRHIQPVGPGPGRGSSSPGINHGRVYVRADQATNWRDHPVPAWC